MKFIVGLLMVICGIALGLYVGLWVCFIGGIIDVIEASAMSVAVGGAKIILAGIAGRVSALSLAIPGYNMMLQNL